MTAAHAAGGQKTRNFALLWKLKRATVNGGMPHRGGQSTLGRQMTFNGISKSPDVLEEAMRRNPFGGSVAVWFADQSAQRSTGWKDNMLMWTWKLVMLYATPREAAE